MILKRCLTCIKIKCFGQMSFVSNYLSLDGYSSMVARTHYIINYCFRCSRRALQCCTILYTIVILSVWSIFYRSKFGFIEVFLATRVTQLAALELVRDDRIDKTFDRETSTAPVYIPGGRQVLSITLFFGGACLVYLQPHLSGGVGPLEIRTHPNWESP